MSLHPKPRIGRTIRWYITEDEKQWLLGMRAAWDCARKQDFETEESAMRVAIKRMSGCFGKLRVYKCEACKFWHLTSQL